MSSPKVISLVARYRDASFSSAFIFCLAWSFPLIVIYRHPDFYGKVVAALENDMFRGFVLEYLFSSLLILGYLLILLPVFPTVMKSIFWPCKIKLTISPEELRYHASVLFDVKLKGAKAIEGVVPLPESEELIALRHKVVELEAELEGLRRVSDTPEMVSPDDAVELKDSPSNTPIAPLN